MVNKLSILKLGDLKSEMPQFEIKCLENEHKLNLFKYIPINANLGLKYISNGFFPERKEVSSPPLKNVHSLNEDLQNYLFSNAISNIHKPLIFTHSRYMCLTYNAPKEMILKNKTIKSRSNVIQ